MTKSMNETVAERRDYVNRIRESFYREDSDRRKGAPAGEERQEEIHFSSLGLRTMIAVLIFAAFVYCDRKQITFQQYKTQDVWKQLEWNPLPLEELEEVFHVGMEKMPSESR
ncbi:hypothetical protein C805_01880 [Eubacterium sp. 14-2]|uniref:hypothetical protein n=1 Tax=Eubacterium sp. 14-2 TaxID=1235790 RepID=UPI000339BE04|nr:hypothetical protein [Eubacterium sp. 14-2]EOT27772.1 hypothetical protein C805_01880 [Eubacterium sp. 14-2]